MMPPFLFGWLVTVVVEPPCVACFYPGHRLRMAALCALTTSLTNLVMNLVLPRWLGIGTAFLLMGELGALLVEGLVYALARAPRDWERALAASALANAASYASGLVLPQSW